MKHVDIKSQLVHYKYKAQTNEDAILNEVNKILINDLITEKKILTNLKHYNSLIELINEEDVSKEFIFNASQIKHIALSYRLKFIDSQFFKAEMPYEAILKIKDLNTSFNKELREFKLLAPTEVFHDASLTHAAVLFAPTNYGNYYMIHCWGKPLKWHRKLISWPLKNFDNLFISVIVFTLLLTLCIPTEFITLDEKANYWSGYRAAAFMHLLIFNCGVTAYFTFVMGKNLSSTIWNHYKDF